MFNLNIYVYYSNHFKIKGDALFTVNEYLSNANKEMYAARDGNGKSFQFCFKRFISSKRV